MRSGARKKRPRGPSLLVSIALLLFVWSCRSESKRTASSTAPKSNEASAKEAESKSENKDNKNDDAIVVAFGNGYEPFAWGEGALVKGVQVDFVREILEKRMGLRVVTRGCPWKRCQKLVRTGKMDGFFTVPTERRARYTRKSSIPFYETHFLMHVSVDSKVAKDLRRVRSLEDLENMPHIRHIYMHGSGWHENALKKMKHVITVPDASVIPRMLALGRADVYIEQDEMFRYQARAAGVLDRLSTIEDPVIKKVKWHLFIGNKSKHVSVMSEVDRVLETLEATGELEKIKQELFRKYGI